MTETTGKFNISLWVRSPKTSSTIINQLLNRRKNTRPDRPPHLNNRQKLRIATKIQNLKPKTA
ncbi:hypothetical protein QUA81_27420 [Microcoleus sp. F6_B4]